MTRHRFQDWLTLSARPGLAPSPSSVRVWDTGVSLLPNDVPDPLPRLDVLERSILDVGCDSGAFALESLRRGARRVLGIDADPDRIRMARAYASLAELPARFEVMDAEERLPEGRFDLVYCSKLSTFSNPSDVISRLARLAGEQLVLEFDGPRSPNASAFLHQIGAPRPRDDKDSWPPVVVSELRGGAARSFLSPSAVETLLLKRSARFSKVDITPAGAGRYRAVATRRVVSRLVIVAAAGRIETERLVNQIRTGEACPDLLERLDLDSVGRWAYAPNGVLASSDDRVTAGIVYGYDLHSARRRRGDGPVEDDLIDLLESAAEVLLVTAWADPDTLQARGRRRVGVASRTLRQLERHPVRAWAGTIASLAKRALRTSPMRWTPGRLRRFVGRARSELDLERRIERVRARLERTEKDDRAYRQMDEHLLGYARWMDFCSHLDADEHWVVDNTSERWQVHHAAEWGHLLVERARRGAAVRPG